MTCLYLLQCVVMFMRSQFSPAVTRSTTLYSSLFEKAWCCLLSKCWWSEDQKGQTLVLFQRTINQHLLYELPPTHTAFRLSNLTWQHSQYPPFLFSLRLSFFPRSPPDLKQNTDSHSHSQKNLTITFQHVNYAQSTFALSVSSSYHLFHVPPLGTDCRVEESGGCTQACWTREGR